MTIPKKIKSIINKSRIFIHKLDNKTKHFLVEYANHYNWHLGTDYRNIIKLIKQNITTIPKCGLSYCDEPVKIYATSDFCGLAKGCCTNHIKKITNLENFGCEYSLQAKEIREKIVNTNLEKYGNKNPLNNITIRDKAIQTNLIKFGVENPMQSESTILKVKHTKREKYGDANYNNPEQAKLTWLNNYGFDNPMKADVVKNKSKLTCLEKYNSEYHLTSVQSKEKIKQTNVIKFGYENPLSNNAIRLKCQNTMLEKYEGAYPSQCQQFIGKMFKNTHKFKEYIWKTGEISKVQGYEHIVLKELENSGYKYDEVLTDVKDMPVIWYEFENKKHRYYPDFYIPKENLIIEVKSEYIMLRHFSKNMYKFQAVKDLGFNFKLEVR